MPIRTRSGTKYKEWMLQKVTERLEDDTDDTGFITLTGMVMRSFEMFKTYDACWLHIKCICTNVDLPPPHIQSSTSSDPRIRLLDDLGLTSDLPLQQRPWIADLHACNTDLLYNALPKLTNWPEDIDDIDNEWEELEENDDMSDIEEGPLEECSICRQTYPAWLLRLKDQTLKNGQWVGPHCIGCDIELFENGTSSRFTPEWHARGFSVDAPITIINETQG